MFYRYKETGFSEMGIQIFNLNLINLGYWDLDNPLTNKVSFQLAAMFRKPDSILEFNLTLGKRTFFVAFLESA